MLISRTTRWSLSIGLRLRWSTLVWSRLSVSSAISALRAVAPYVSIWRFTMVRLRKRIETLRRRNPRVRVSFCRLQSSVHVALGVFEPPEEAQWNDETTEWSGRNPHSSTVWIGADVHRRIQQPETLPSPPNETEEHPQQFACPIPGCFKTFSNQTSLNFHKYRVHLGIDSSICTKSRW